MNIIATNIFAPLMHPPYFFVSRGLEASSSCKRLHSLVQSMRFPMSRSLPTGACAVRCSTASKTRRPQPAKGSHFKMTAA